MFWISISRLSLESQYLEVNNYKLKLNNKYSFFQVNSESQKAKINKVQCVPWWKRNFEIILLRY